MIGRGLLRLFIALWIIWIAFGVADSYKELATFAGYDGWTVQKALERNRIEYGPECAANPASFACIHMNSVRADEVVRDADVLYKVNGFFLVMIVVPFVVLIMLIAMYMLGKWVIKGFHKHEK